jgi:hypothetical protein
MIVIPYTTTVPINPATAGKKIALVHPGGSQPGSLYFRGFDLPSASGGGVRLQIARHPSVATGGDTNTASSFLDNAPASFAEVRTGSVVWPSDTETITEPAFAEPRRMGGGIVVPQQNASAGALVIGPGHSLVIETLDPDVRDNATYDLRLFWGEQRPSITILSSADLPAFAAYTTGAYFPVPPGWTHVTFYLTYTAKAGSSNARPCWRLSGSDGTNDFPLLLRDDTLDLTTPNVARRLVYQHEDRLAYTIAPTIATRLLISYKLPPGVPLVRLDVSECGDLTNRGAAIVAITGE